jgi:Peptidase C10 family/Spi protease inhibitor
MKNKYKLFFYHLIIWLCLSNFCLAQTENSFSISETVAKNVGIGKMKSETNVEFRPVIKSIEPFLHENELLLYNINFEGGGFVLVARDMRISPIVGYSEINSFNTDFLNPENDNFSEGLYDWLLSYKLFTTAVVKSNVSIPVEIESEWHRLHREGIDPGTPLDPDIQELCCLKNKYPCTEISCPWIKKGNDNEDDPCEIKDNTIGPLVTTDWKQFCNNFNNLCPANGIVKNNTCSNNTCFRTKVGCFSIAGGILSAFYQILPPSHGNPVNLSSLNLVTNNNPNFSIQQLLVDYGKSANSIYGCKVTATTPISAKLTLKSIFPSIKGYVAFNSAIIKDEITNNRLIFMKGYETYKMPITVNNLKEGHFWICSGYKEKVNCKDEIVRKSVYMNWGHGGHTDGWYEVPCDDCYNFVEFDPATNAKSAYDSVEMLYNIK